MIIGHDAIISDLKQFADRRALSHAYIFFGAARIGKRLVAAGLAGYLETGDFSADPNARILSDALIISPGTENSIGIDRIREIKNFIWQMPNRSPYRTVIIDGGENLTPEAQNALLKINEEPPSQGLIILVVNDYERLLPTIQSRMQKLYFAGVPEANIRELLVREWKCDAKKAEELARESNGAPGLAWAMLFDEQFQTLKISAEKFLKMDAYGRKAFIKDLVEPEEFNFSRFLEALAIVYIGNAASRGKRALAGHDFNVWHRLMDLRREADYFPLNPRLQLMALATRF